jgi:hypothetical protein
MRLAGGTLRFDGNTAADDTINTNNPPSVFNNDAKFNTEILGPMRPFAGQSTIVMNPNAARLLVFNFANAATADLTRGGQLAFVGASLSGGGGGQSNVTFTANPSLINGILPWGLAQTNYTSAPSAASNATDPDTFATIGANGVMPVTSFINNVLTSSTANVRLRGPIVQSGSALANSLLLDTGGSLALSGPLNLTSGALFNRAVGGSITGSGAIIAPGRLYVSASQPFTIDAPISAAHLSKGGNSSVTITGAVSLGANPLVAVNAGTLSFGPSATVTAASGNVDWQVSKGATLANIPGPVAGTLRGNGTVAGPVTIASGGTIYGSALAGGLANGDSPGVLTLTGPLVLQGGARIRININSKYDGPYTQSQINGPTLDLSGASSSNRIVLEPQSLLLSNNGPGAIYDFTGGTFPVSLGTFDNVIGFSPDKFIVSTALFSNSTSGFSVSIYETGGTVLTFTATPEPTGVGVVLLGLLSLSRFRRATLPVASFPRLITLST